MDNLEKFNSQLIELVRNSGLSSSMISMCFDNIILQIKVSQLQNIINSKQKELNKENIDSDKNVESVKEKKEIIKKNKPQSGGGGVSTTPLVNKDSEEINTK